MDIANARRSSGVPCALDGVKGVAHEVMNDTRAP